MHDPKMDRKMEIIKELMAQLEAEMQPGADDFSERLGREPKVELEVGMENDPMDGDDLPMDGDLEVDEMGEEMGPDAMLKKRLLKLRA